MLKIVIYHNSYIIPKIDQQRRERKEYSKKQRDEMNIHRSLRRTKTTIKDIMLSNRFDLWCTFTYNCRNCHPKCDNNPCTCSPATCKRFDMHYTNTTLRNWFQNQRKRTSPNLKYLAVPEYHKNGAIHFHCLMSGFNGRLKETKKRTSNGQKVYNAAGYYSGWTEFVKIGELFDDDSFDDQYKRVSSYLTKYVTKDMPVIYGKRRFLVSEGLTRPTTTVNGVFKYALGSVIKNYKPEYINDYLEVQKHPIAGRPLVRDYQSELF